MSAVARALNTQPSSIQRSLNSKRKVPYKKRYIIKKIDQTILFLGTCLRHSPFLDNISKSKLYSTLKNASKRSLPSKKIYIFFIWVRTTACFSRYELAPSASLNQYMSPFFHQRSEAFPYILTTSPFHAIDLALLLLSFPLPSTRLPLYKKYISHPPACPSLT